MTIVQLNKEQLEEILVKANKSNALVYSNLLGDIKNTLTQHTFEIKEIKANTERIEVAVNKTNGRVTVLEREKAEIDGAAGIVKIIILPILGFLSVAVIYLLTKYHG